MNSKRLTKRMQALTNLAQYSTGVCLEIPTEFIDKDVGEDWDFVDELKGSINCLVQDERFDVVIMNDDLYTLINIKVIE